MSNAIVSAIFFMVVCAACSPKVDKDSTQIEIHLSAEQIPNLIIDAGAELDNMNFGRAIDITYRISKFDSNNIEAYVLRTQAMTMLGNKTEALNALEAAFEHGLKDLLQIEKLPRLTQLRESPEYQLLVNRYGLHSTAAISKNEISAGNVSIKEEGGNQVIKAGDVSITVPKD